MTNTPQLRDRIAAAIVADMRKAIPPLPMSSSVPLGGLGRTEFDVADAVLAVVQPELDQLRAAGMREAAAMLRKYCPTHGTADTCLMDCHCAGADEIDRDARAVSTPTDGCGCKTDVHPGHYPSCPTRDATPTPQSAACPCRAPGQDGDGRVRYQARDGEFVNLPCRSHVDVPTA